MFSPDSQKIIFTCGDNTVHVYDLTAKTETLSIKGNGQQIGFVAISHDGKTLATCSRQETVELWDAATGKSTGSLKGTTASIAFVSLQTGR